MEYLNKVNKLFLITVLIPTASAIVYFGLMASDVYISQSQFIIRSSTQQNLTGLSGLLKGTGFSRSDDDSYAVQDFITSRDAMTVLNRELKIKQAFEQGKIDLFSRFGALDWDDSLENFYRYYQKMVGVELATDSSIVTLSTRAYTADEAKAMNELLLELGEKLVNQMSDRARQDTIDVAMKEVALAEKKDQAASVALANYRNRNNVMDPERQSAIPLQQIGQLQEELISTRLQIAQMEKLAKNNPQLPSLRQREMLLQSEIENQTRSVAGQANQSLASKAANYQRLVLEKEFADKMLASAMTSLEQARIEAQHKQLYLERIAQPSLPDKAMEPHRVRNILATFLLGLILWGVLTIVIGGVREHYDR